MRSKNSDIINQNRVFLWLAGATGILLLIPFLVMQFNWQVPDPGSTTPGGVNWTLFDFLVMGTLIFGMGSIFALAARKFKRNRLTVAAIVAAVFFWLWAELAVGVFTNLGS